MCVRAAPIFTHDRTVFVFSINVSSTSIKAFTSLNHHRGRETFYLFLITNRVGLEMFHDVLYDLNFNDVKIAANSFILPQVEFYVDYVTR